MLVVSSARRQRDRGVECREVCQRAHIADEQHPAGRQTGVRRVEDPHEVVHVREILDYRVEDDRIEQTGGRQRRQVIGGQPLEGHIRQP